MTEAMSHAQRLQTAFNGGAPDRIPSMPKIWFTLAANLLKMDVADIVRDPVTAMNCVVDAAVAMNCDGARLFLNPPRNVQWQGEKLIEVDDAGKPLGEVDLAGGLSTHLDDPSRFDPADPHCMAFNTTWKSHEPWIKDEADLRRIRIADKACFEQWGYGKIVEDLKAKVGDRCGLVGDCDSATMAYCVGLRGMMQAMMDLLDDPSFVHKLMGKGVAASIERGKFWIDRGINILRLNDSVGNMSVISPQQWREFVGPHMKEVCDELHRYKPGVKIYCHICGNVTPIVEDLAAVGLDCIAPLDPLGGVSVKDVRRRVGKDTVLMGGVHTLLFTRSDTAELRKASRECLDGNGQMESYILGSGCALPPDSTADNMQALAEEAANWRA